MFTLGSTEVEAQTRDVVIFRGGGDESVSTAGQEGPLTTGTDHVCYLSSNLNYSPPQKISDILLVVMVVVVVGVRVCVV